MTDSGPTTPGRGAGSPARLRRALIALCVTQITGYGILYYAFPVMLSAVSRQTGWSTASAMGAFSTGAVVSAAAGVVAGRLIDSRGPRPVMTIGSVLGVVSVVAIAAAPNLLTFYAAWTLAGVAQAAVLYPPAFAALTGWYGPGRVRALTTLTLAAGFASTIFAPLTATLLDHLDWRQTYLILAAILAIVTIPLHAVFLTPPWTTTRTRTGPAATDRAHARAVLRSRPFITLTAAMTLAAFGMYAATVNLVPLLTARGMGTHLAALTLGLCGAGQVLGRLGYPQLSARIGLRTRAFAVLATGAATILMLALLPGPAAALIIVAILAGAVRGLFTLLEATAVADQWGTRAFGRINGVFTAPITTAAALAPGGGVLLAALTGGYPASLTILALITLTAALAAAATIPHTPATAPPDPTAGVDSRERTVSSTGPVCVTIRPMTSTDADQVLAIYQAGLDTGDASFETTAPPWTEFDAGRLPRHRFVAADTATGRLLGWAAATAVSSRRVYAGVVEHSVYVHPGAHNRGVGTALLQALIGSTEAAGIWTIQSGIFPENTASLALHHRAGFRTVGTRERIGQHHGRWRDVVLLERRATTIT